MVAGYSMLKSDLAMMYSVAEIVAISCVVGLRHGSFKVHVNVLVSVLAA